MRGAGGEVERRKLVLGCAGLTALFDAALVIPSLLRDRPDITRIEARRLLHSASLRWE